MSGINRDEWLAAVKAVDEMPVPESDALTAQEFSDLVECERSHALKRLRGLIAAGACERTKKMIRRSDGGRVWVPAYRLLKRTQSGNDRSHKRNTR